MLERPLKAAELKMPLLKRELEKRGLDSKVNRVEWNQCVSWESDCRLWGVGVVEGGAAYRLLGWGCQYKSEREGRTALTKQLSIVIRVGD